MIYMYFVRAHIIHVPLFRHVQDICSSNIGLVIASTRALLHQYWNADSQRLPFVGYKTCKVQKFKLKERLIKQQIDLEI